MRCKVLLFILLVSCVKESTKEIIPSNNFDGIKVTGEESLPASKTTLNNLQTIWKGGSDKIGVYSPQARTTSEGAAGVTNAQFTAVDNSLSSSFTGSMYWGEGTHNFYSYYPYNSNYVGVFSAVPIALPELQTQSSGSSHIGNYDFIIANPVSISPGIAGQESVVNFKYNHLFALMEFKLLSSVSKTIKSVKLTAPSNINLSFTEGSIDISQSTPSSGAPYLYTIGTGSNVVNLSINPGVTLTNNSETTPSIYLMIVPCDLSSNYLTITITDSNNETYVVEKIGRNFQRGKRYLSTISIQTSSGVVVDIENNVYKTIELGTQIWMADNLNVTKFNDGTAISNITDNTAWASLTSSAYLDYDNNPANSTIYGKLYNWFAVDNNTSTKNASNGGKNICPSGWHVASDAEWSTLTTFLADFGFGYGGSGSDIAKSFSYNSGWPTSTSEGAPGYDQESNNSSGFSAKPGGFRSQYSSSTFSDIGTSGYWWSTTVNYSYSAWYRSINYNINEVFRGDIDKKNGYSVRCIRDNNYVSQVSDVQNNVYKTVKIGTQTWMAENLRVTRYTDNNDINYAFLNWGSQTTGSFCWYNNDPTSHINSDGALYNWYAVDNNALTKVASNGGRSICPTGWRVPSDSDWSALISYLANNGYGYEGSGEDVAKSLASTTVWSSASTAGCVGSDPATNNNTSFNALPSGVRSNTDAFSLYSYYGYFWSTSPYDSGNGRFFALGYSSQNKLSGNLNKSYGLSVRCIKEE